LVDRFDDYSKRFAMWGYSPQAWRSPFCGSAVKIAPSDMDAFTRISVAPRESVAFSFKVSNLSLKCFALLFSVL
jgi:hypothetical protein